MGSLQNTSVRGILLVLVAGILAIIQVNFVGDVTIYSLNANAGREASHERFIDNKTPEGGWNKAGANGTNIRIAIPYLVEFLHRTTGLGVAPIYKGVDLVFMWLTPIILFLFLRRWFTPHECLLACAYLAAIWPLTFAYHSYHPWDRPSLVLWLLAFWAVRDKRFWAFWAISVVAMFIKYDVIVLPVLYFLANVSPQNWPKILVQSGIVGATLLAIYIGLQIVFPGGFEPQDEVAIMLHNLRMMANNPIGYAPFLAFGLPVFLSILGYQDADRFMRAGLLFAGLLVTAFFTSSLSEEVRTEQMLFPLLAPAALLGLRRILDRAPVASESISNESSRT